MSTLQINAEIDSTEILFDWAGKDLATPLDALREHLVAEAKALAERSGVKSTKDLPRFADLTKNDPEADAKQKIKLALADAFEAQLWAAECRRAPDKVWRLNMARLKWIFRQTAP